MTNHETSLSARTVVPGSYSAGSWEWRWSPDPNVVVRMSVRANVGGALALAHNAAPHIEAALRTVMDVRTSIEEAKA